MSEQAPTNNQAASSTTTQARRRSSSFMPAFESLSQQKRSGGQEGAERRQSLSDQHAKGGIFSQLFHNNLGRNAK